MSIGRATDGLVEWAGKMVALDRSRVIVRLETRKPPPAEGSNVWLQFGPRQRESPIVCGGMVWGVDSDGSITVLLSLTTREFDSLKSLVNALVSGKTASLPLPPIPSQPRAEPQADPPVTQVPLRPMVSEPRPEPEAEPPVASVSPHPMPSEPRPEPEAPVTPVLPAPELPDVNLAQQADAAVGRGDYGGAWRLYYQALQATPEDVSLWYGLGVTLSYLNKRKEAEEAFQYVARHGPPDSEEVRVARQWLADAQALAESAALTGVAEPVRDARDDRAAATRKETRVASEPRRAPVEPPRAKLSEPRAVRQAEARVTPAPRRAESANVKVSQQAEALAARGDYEGAWRLYYQALQAAPEDISLWYGLGVTASHLGQRKETEAEPQRTAPRIQPDPKEAGLSRRALISAGALAELAALTRAAETVGDVRREEAAAKGKTTRRASEPVQPPRARPSEPRAVQQAEARITRREDEAASDRKAPRRRTTSEESDDRTIDSSITKDERERALVALIDEGYKMPPSRTELLAKVMEMRNTGDKERSKASKKARGRTRS